MTRFRYALLFLLLTTTSFAQDAATITQRARAWLDTLTSPAFHGRGYVNDGQRIASDWIAKQFQRIGLQPVKDDFFEPFQFNVNSFPDTIIATVDGRRLAPGTDFLVDPASGKADGTYEIAQLNSAIAWLAQWIDQKYGDREVVREIRPFIIIRG